MARRPTSPPSAELTPEKMRQGITRLERRIAEVAAFDPATIRKDDDSEIAGTLRTAVNSALVATFGHDTPEYNNYSAAANFSWPINIIHPTPIREIQENLARCRARSLQLLRQAVSFLREELESIGEPAANGTSNDTPVRGQSAALNIVIGHGGSPLWRELKDFLKDRLGLSVEEFNSVSAAGIPTAERLTEMLDAARFSFLVMTAEDQQPDGRVRARENVVHEAGLFQGRLGFKRAIILLEDGCEEFSNIRGLGQIRFPRGNIAAIFEDIRRVLEREGVRAHH